MWLACLGEYYVGTAVQVRSTKFLSGNGEDTMPATIRRLAEAGLPTPLVTTVCTILDNADRIQESAKCLA